MLNDIGQVIWESKYSAYKKYYDYFHSFGELPESYYLGCKRVVSITDGYFSRDEQQKLFYYIYNQKFSPGGRIYYAAGKPKPQYANCMLFDVADNRQGWAKALYQNTMALTGGAGVGNEVSQVRHKGAYINGLGGTASGTLSVVSMINEVARHIMQGNTRRSACYSAVHWQHKDVWEWLTVKEWDSTYTELKAKSVDYPAPLDVHNISIRYDPEFIEAYHDDTHSWHNHAVTLFDKHIQQMVKWGDPSIQYDWDNQILRNA